jgi:hypothetical protein
MEPKDDSIRERLLSQLPQPANLPTYRDEVALLLEKKEKEVRRERRVMIELWVFTIVVSIVFLWMGAQRMGSKAVDEAVLGPYFMGCAGFWFLFALVYFVAHSVSRSRLALLKEVKQVQVQVLELQALLQKGGAQTLSNP